MDCLEPNYRMLADSKENMAIPKRSLHTEELKREMAADFDRSI